MSPADRIRNFNRRKADDVGKKNAVGMVEVEVKVEVSHYAGLLRRSANGRVASGG